MAVISTERPDLAARARAGGITLNLHPSYNWTRRKVLHVIADDDGNCVHAETSMDKLLSWVIDNDIKRLRLVLLDGRVKYISIGDTEVTIPRIERVAPFATISPVG